MANIMAEQYDHYDGERYDPDTVAEVAGSRSTKNIGSQLFVVEVLERNLARGHGLVTSVSTGNNVILVGTDKGWLVRHDFSGEEPPLDLDLTTGKALEQAVLRVFIDPGGRHGLAVVRTSTGTETHYLHTKSRKSRVLTRLKGLTLCSVAWNKHQLSEATTREIILGTSSGQLFETSLEEKERREKPLKLLYELTELQEPVVGLQMEMSGSGSQIRFFVIAVTLTRLYSFTGLGSLEAIFAAYADRPVRFTELPGEERNSELHFSAKQRRTECFAWLAGPGIYYGGLNLGLQPSAQHAMEETFLENKSLLEYSKLSDGGRTVKPCSMALTNFHFLLLYENKLKVVNRVSQKVVEEKIFESLLDQGVAPMLGLCTDAIGGAVYAFNENILYEIGMNDEDRDMWQVYLDNKDYATALEHCRNTLQRDKVYVSQVDCQEGACASAVALHKHVREGLDCTNME